MIVRNVTWKIEEIITNLSRLKRGPITTRSREDPNLEEKYKRKRNIVLNSIKYTKEIEWKK